MGKLKSHLKKDWQLYVIFIPALIWIIMFAYIPFAENVIISMQDYNIDKGIAGSKFVWFKNYIAFFSNENFGKLLWNTLALNLTILAIGFPLAIVLAIMIYESNSKFIRGLTQTATFLPFFISAVVVCNMVIEFLKTDTGMLSNIFKAVGLNVNLSDPKQFRMIYTTMETWQTVGYNSLIYFAALSAIDPILYESAKIEGASKFQQIRHITLPSIASTIIITLILRVGRLLQMGYEKILILYNDGNRVTSETISTYVYNFSLNPRVGLPDYAMGAAIGLFDAVVAIILVSLVNQLAKKVSDSKLW